MKQVRCNGCGAIAVVPAGVDVSSGVHIRIGRRWRFRPSQFSAGSHECHEGMWYGGILIETAPLPENAPIRRQSNETLVAEIARSLSATHAERAEEIVAELEWRLAGSQRARAV